jgi:carbamoyl-phosphate synthase large subunit
VTTRASASAETIRFLLLSVGGGVAHNFFEALGHRRQQCVLIGTNSLAAAASSFRCDAVYRVPPAADRERYRARILELIEEERPDLVVPLRDDDVLVLAEIGERHPRLVPMLLTGTVASARVMNDKWETACFAARHGLPFAPTVQNAADARELAAVHGLPLIGKPRAGHASKGVVLLRSTDEIGRAFASRDDLVAQPYLDPPSDMAALIRPFDGGLPIAFSMPGRMKYSVQGFVGPDGSVSRSFGTASVEAGAHATEYRRRDDADLIEIGQAYAHAAAAERWKGPLNVQLKRTPAGKLVAFELNGRFTGGTAPRALLGFDEIGEVVARFLPDLAFPPLRSSACEVAQSYLRSYPLSLTDVAEMERSGKWSGTGGA